MAKKVNGQWPGAAGGEREREHKVEEGMSRRVLYS